MTSEERTISLPVFDGDVHLEWDKRLIEAFRKLSPEDQEAEYEIWWAAKMIGCCNPDIK